MSSDSESDRRSESESEDEVPAKKGRGGKKPAKKTQPVTVILTFQEAEAELEKVQDALENNTATRPSKHRNKNVVTRTKLKLDVPWSAVSAALEKEAGQRGISNETIQMIWGIIKHSASPMKMKLKQELVLCMVPIDEAIPSEFVEKVIYSIADSSEKREMERFKLTLLQYLIGLFEYNLLDVGIFSNYLFYALIFHATRHDSLIPWACYFIKKITKRELIQRSYILDLMDLMATPLNALSLKLVGDVLRQFKLLRPDLLPNNVFKFNAVGENRKMDLSPVFRKRLFEAKSRLLGIRNTLLHIPEEDAMDVVFEDDDEVTGKGRLLTVLNSKCFPEFKLFQDGDLEDYRMWGELPAYDLMRCSIKKRETLPLLIGNPAAIEHFNTYLSLVFQHKFNAYDVKNRKRYDFILQRCVEVTILQDKGLAAVDEWLLDFLLTWDLVLFKRQILDLLPYVSPVDFAHGYKYVLQKLENMFLDGEAIDRIEVWKILENWFCTWTDETLKNNDSGAEILENNARSLEFLFKFITALVCKYACVDGHKDVIFLDVCCQSYYKFVQIFNGVERVPFLTVPPRALWHMVVLSDSLLALNSFCNMFSVVEFDKKAVKDLRKTHREHPLLVWNTQIFPEVGTYFGYSNPAKDGKFLFQDLFHAEVDVLSYIANPDEAHNFEPEVIDTSKRHLASLLENAQVLAGNNSRSLAFIKKDPTNTTDRLAFNLDKEKALEFAPAVHDVIVFFESELKRWERKARKQKDVEMEYETEMTLSQDESKRRDRKAKKQKDLEMEYESELNLSQDQAMSI